MTPNNVSRDDTGWYSAYADACVGKSWTPGQYHIFRAGFIAANEKSASRITQLEAELNLEKSQRAAEAEYFLKETDSLRGENARLEKERVDACSLAGHGIVTIDELRTGEGTERPAGGGDCRERRAE